jgi:hypothetical protein
MAFVRHVVVVASAQSRYRLTALERGVPAPIGAPVSDGDGAVRVAARVGGIGARRPVRDRLGVPEAARARGAAGSKHRLVGQRHVRPWAGGVDGRHHIRDPALRRPRDGRGGLQFILIISLQGIWLPEHGYDFSRTPLWAGIYMLPLIAGFLLAGPVSGWLSDRFGARPFATAGAGACADGPRLLPALDLVALPRSADLRVRVRDRRLRGGGRRVASARREVPLGGARAEPHHRT